MSSLPQIKDGNFINKKQEAMFDPRSFNRLVLTIAVFRKYLQDRDNTRSFILPTHFEVRSIESASLIA